eukprot:scaffold1377_cov390-Prasinococcus_capsulatus_cf.AAC.3
MAAEFVRRLGCVAASTMLLRQLCHIAAYRSHPVLHEATNALLHRPQLGERRGLQLRCGNPLARIQSDDIGDMATALLWRP